MRINFITLPKMYGIPNLKYKTTLCNAWKEGFYCDKDMACFFAHGEHELRTMEQNREFTYAQNPHLVESNTGKFKTRYCKFYNKGKFGLSKGTCKLGGKCTFAHHKEEKRPIIYVPKQEYIPHQYEPQNLHYQYDPYYAYNQTYYQMNQGSSPPQYFTQQNIQTSSSPKKSEYIEKSTESPEQISPQKEESSIQNPNI